MTINKPYKVLTFDGGGIRGALSAKLLTMVSQEVPFVGAIDCIAGTSTGSILAVAMAFGIEPSQVLDMYQSLGSAAFPKSEKDFLKEAKYDLQMLHQLLKQVFPEDATLSILPKRVCITAYDTAKQGGVRLFHNFDSEGAQVKIIDAILASCAAPGYFPSYNGFLDGGVFACDSSLAAIATICQTYPELSMEDLRLVSFGTGVVPFGFNKEINWGKQQWAGACDNSQIHSFPIFSLMTQANVAYTSKILSMMLKDNYLKLNPSLDSPVEIDESDKVLSLIGACESYKENESAQWNKAISWLKAIV